MEMIRQLSNFIHLVVAREEVAGKRAAIDSPLPRIQELT
jgi:hypothetical protein